MAKLPATRLRWDIAAGTSPRSTLLPLIFFLARRARRPLHSARCEQSPRGSAAPQIHMQVGPRKSTQDRQGAPRESPRGHGLDYGRRPQAAWTVHCTPRRPRTLVPAPRGHADARRPCATNPGPSLVTPCTPIGSWGPFWAGGQAPPFHQVTRSRQGEFNAIPRQASLLALPFSPSPFGVS